MLKWVVLVGVLVMSSVAFGDELSELREEGARLQRLMDSQAAEERRLEVERTRLDARRSGLARARLELEAEWGELFELDRDVEWALEEWSYECGGVPFEDPFCDELEAALRLDLQRRRTWRADLERRWRAHQEEEADLAAAVSAHERASEAHVQGEIELLFGTTPYLYRLEAYRAAGVRAAAGRMCEGRADPEDRAACVEAYARGVHPLFEGCREVRDPDAHDACLDDAVTRANAWKTYEPGRES